MLPAVEPFEEALCMARITDPRIPVYSNVDSKTIYRNAATIRKHLPRQIVQCVKWEQSMCQIFKYEKEEYFPNVFECGPGNSLSAMLHKINGKVGKKAVSVNL
jgi:malonyl CoA-acyl carrier protein transacylase